MSEQSGALQLLTDAGVISGPIEDHLAALSTQDRPPAIAVVNCLARPKEAWPPFRALVERAADGQWLSASESMLLFRGLHILAGGRDSTIFASLLRLLHRPQEHLDDLFGDAISENMALIIASTFDEDVEALLGLIEAPAIDEYVRNAAIGAATFLTWDGRIERDRMVAFLVRFNDIRPAEDGSYLWVGWLEAIALLGLRSLASLAYQALSDGRVPPEFFEREDFEEDLCRAESAPDEFAGFEFEHLGYMDDVMEALDRFGDHGSFDRVEPDEELWEPTAFDLGDPIINPLRHVGRNDPCPCGSGKKAKKCCLDA